MHKYSSLWALVVSHCNALCSFITHDTLARAQPPLLATLYLEQLESSGSGIPTSLSYWGVPVHLFINDDLTHILLLHICLANQSMYRYHTYSINRLWCHVIYTLKGEENLKPTTSKEVTFPELKVVRVGQQQKIHPDILPISLDELARKHLAKGV